MYNNVRPDKTSTRTLELSKTQCDTMGWGVSIVAGELHRFIGTQYMHACMQSALNVGVVCIQ